MGQPASGHAATQPRRNGVAVQGVRERSRARVPDWLETVGAWSWRLSAMAVVLYLLLQVLVRARVAVVPALLAAVLASLLDPLVQVLHRIRIPRAIAAFFTVLLALAGIGGVFALVGAGVSEEQHRFASAVEDGYGSLLESVAGIVGISTDALQDWMSAHVSRLRSVATSAAGRVLSGVADVLTTVTIALLTLVFTWFFLWNGREQVRNACDWLPPGPREHVRELGQRMWRAVGAFMRGMLVVALADAVLFGLGLWIIGVPMVLPLMLLMFMGAFIPYVGAVVSGALAGLVGLAAGGTGQAGLSVLVAVVVQQLEGNLLSPVVMGRATHLHPALILFVVTVGGALAGVGGVFLAVPMTACVMTGLNYAREQHVKRAARQAA